MFLLHSFMPTVTSKIKLKYFKGFISFIISKKQAVKITVTQIFAMLKSPFSKSLKNKLKGGVTGGFSSDILCEFLVKTQNKRLIKRCEKSS